MLQEFGAFNDGVNPLSNIEVTAWLYELYGYVTQKLKSWCLYIKYAEALNNPEAKLLGEYRGVPCAAKTAELVNNVLECNVMLSVVFSCGKASQLWPHYNEVRTDRLKSLVFSLIFCSHFIT
jgi:hypothetical protein